MLDPLLLVQLADWSAATAESSWLSALEAGRVLFFPRLAFGLAPAEQELLAPQLQNERVRNISLDAQGTLKGVTGDAPVQATVAGLMARFALRARGLVRDLFPGYEPHLRAAPTSLRPAEVSTREQSVRADDRRLHVDAFPSRPNRGERILRVFTNVNPHGAPRVWRVGEPFEEAARRFLPQVTPYSPWQARVLNGLGITKSLRSEYDHLMLQLHDRMKADETYQRHAPQARVDFPTGSTWVCFSDQVLHAAMAGQYLLEQTFHLPLAAQADPSTSPLGVLTRLAGRPLRNAPLPPGIGPPAWAGSPSRA